MKYLALLYIFSICNFTIFSGQSIDNKVLFIIERSRDSNVVVYAINENKNGQVNHENPIHIFWMNPNQKSTKELSWAQKKYAYGLEYIDKNKDNFTFQFVSSNKKTFELYQTSSGYLIYVDINKKKSILKKIKVDFSNQSFWMPEIEAITLIGIDLKNGTECVERINP